MADKQEPEGPSGSDGANAGWAVVGYLLAGIAIWGFAGWLVDHWLDLRKPIGLMVGMLVGMAGAIFLIIKKLGTSND